MEDSSFVYHIQLSDMVLIGMRKNINVAFSFGNNDDGQIKASILSEILPVIKHFTNVDLPVYGDDPDGDGICNTGENICHELIVNEYVDFLSSLRSR